MTRINDEHVVERSVIQSDNDLNPFCGNLACCTVNCLQKEVRGSIPIH